MELHTTKAMEWNQRGVKNISPMSYEMLVSDTDPAGNPVSKESLMVHRMASL